ncbi:hypothetical protein KCU91_g100, partial [Aureobasidium melanogenum]
MQPSLICVKHSPYSLIVYLVAAAILATTNQPIALAPYITWVFRLTWEEGVLRLNIDQESRMVWCIGSWIRFIRTSKTPCRNGPTSLPESPRYFFQFSSSSSSFLPTSGMTKNAISAPSTAKPDPTKKAP